MSVLSTLKKNPVSSRIASWPFLDKNSIMLRLILSQTTNFALFKTERVCRRQFSFSCEWQEVLQTVENTVGKGEIARDEQFLLFPLCFQKTCTANTNKGLFTKGLNAELNYLADDKTLLQTCQNF